MDKRGEALKRWSWYQLQRLSAGRSSIDAPPKESIEPSAEQLDEALAKAIAHDGPSLIEVFTDAELL